MSHTQTPMHASLHAYAHFATHIHACTHFQNASTYICDRYVRWCSSTYIYIYHAHAIHTIYRVISIWMHSHSYFGNIHNSPYLHIGNVISTYPQPRQAADRSCCKSTARCCSSRASLPRRFRLGLWHHPMERCLKNASKTRVEVTLFGQAFAKHQPLAFIDVAFINQIKGCTWPQPSAGDSITPLKFPTTASHQAPTRKGKTLAPHSQRFGLFQCFNGGELWDNPKLYTLVSGGRGKSSGTLLRPDKPGLVMRILEEKDSI